MLNTSISDGSIIFLQVYPTLCFPKHRYFKHIIVYIVNCISGRRRGWFGENDIHALQAMRKLLLMDVKEVLIA
jgi:hypothetical protein